MKRIIFSLLASIVCLTAAAQSSNAESFGGRANFISVNGYAEREVVPDEIFITFTIDKNSGQNKASVEQQESDLVAALEQSGIDCAKGLEVTKMLNNIQYYLFKKDKATLSKTYQLKVSTAEMAGNVFELLARQNIQQARVARMSRSDIKQIRRELRIEALNNARDIAREMTAVYGYGIGAPIYIEDNTSNFDFVQYQQRSYDFAEYSEDTVAMASGKTNTTTQFKNIQVESTVTVFFTIVPESDLTTIKPQ